MNLFFLFILFSIFMCVVSTSFILPKIFLKTRILNSFKDLVFVEFNFVDFNTIPIRLAVLFVTFFVVIFSSYYIKEDKILVYFLFMVLAFVVSILILSVANSLFLIFIGWDGLGITSFILIIHYINWKRINNRVFTLLRNRVGDGLILLFMGLVLWDFTASIYLYYFRVLLLIFIFITKRAQVPISAWLPAAMAAPTPVRALVHSSTLVTAGIVLIIKFYYVIIRTTLQNILLFIGVVTIFVAGLTTLLEIDFKKLVALSTLRQIGILVFILGLGRKWLCVFHLISHAFFKSCLFLVVGGSLHFAFSRQDRRSFNTIIFFSFSQRTILFLCCVCLCGLFFTRGFISKDLVLDFISNKNIRRFLLLLFLLRLLLTFIYCIRLFICFLKKTRFGGGLWYSKQLIIIETSPIGLLILSLIACYWLFFNWSFAFSSLVLEKKLLLIIICVFVFLLFTQIIKFFLLKTITILDVFYKKFYRERYKISGKLEKTLIDYFRLVKINLLLSNRLHASSILFNTKTLYCLRCVFLGLFFFILLLSYSLIK